MADWRNSKPAPPVPASLFQANDLTGTTVNRYIVEARLGAGGMGEVYRAEDPALRRLVAIKRMLRREGTEAERAHFLREGQRASSLNHPNIACIHDVLQEHGEVLLVMEYIPGQTLRQRLAAPVPLPEFYAIAIQCADALAAAHAHGILHGDIKPENMMLSNGTLKLLDFGVARRLPTADAPTETSLTFAGSLAGTPRYMAPELFSGQPPDERADIFALGVVLYEMLSGKHPFAAATEQASVGQILHQPAASLRVAKRIPPQLDAVVSKALAKDPDARYRTAAALAADLRALQAGRRPRALASTGGKRRWVWGAAAVAICVGLLALGLGARRLGKTGAGSSPAAALSVQPLLAPHRNLAVLVPLVAGADPKVQAFARGLAESVAAKLAELGANYDLSVVPPEELRSKNVTNLEQARQEFGTTLGLSVSLQTVVDQTRAAYSVIDAATGHSLAGSTITAGSADLFALEDGVAAGVAKALQLTLRPQDAKALSENSTEQPEAYRYFLEGIGFLHESIDPEEISKAQALFEEALRLDPKYGAARAGLGEAYWQRYKLTKQARWIDEARKSCQAAVALGNAGVEGHICLGTLDNGTGAYAEAVQEFTEAQQLDTTNDTACLGLARAYQRLDEPAKAEQTYKNATVLRPQYWRGYNSLGAFYIAEARYPEAAKTFRHAEELAPENYHVASNLGASLLYLGQDGEAVRAFNRSIDIRPSYFAYQNLGVAYFRLRRFTDAVASYRKAVELDSTNYDSWSGLGDALYYGGNQGASVQPYRKAIELAEAQLKVNPHDAEVLGDLASFHSMLGENSAAASLLARSVALGGDDKEVLFNAAVVYNQLHQQGLALDWLRRAMAAGYSRSVIASAVALDNLHTDPRYVALMRQNGMAAAIGVAR